MTDMQRRPGERNRGDVDDLLASGVGADDNGPVMRLWQQAVAKSKRESQARRGRVLAHEDLAQQLKQSPLRLTEATRWSGWTPPRTLAEEACTHCERDTPRPICRGLPHRARVNDSPVRRQLVDIATEAMSREPGRR
jgi:hypothetical protein